MNAVAMRSARTASVARALSSSASKVGSNPRAVAPLAAAAPTNRGDVRRRAALVSAQVRSLNYSIARQTAR